MPKPIPPRRVVQTPPQLHISQDVKPVYSNVVRISHMPSEIVMDFAMKLPGNMPARIMAQVMMSPLSAKLFYRALADNLTKYEASFGEIKIPGEDKLIEYSKLFRPPEKEDDAEGSEDE
jgi:hypothetical protein